MNILFLSNFYPPARSGGYGQLCEDVADGLRARRHTVHVLTSNYRSEQIVAEESHILRQLHLEGDLLYYRPLAFFRDWRRKQRENRAITRQVIQEIAPDVVVVWGMWALSKWVPACFEQLLPGRVVYYLADYWPVTNGMHYDYWLRPAHRFHMRPLKWVLRQFALGLLAIEDRPSLEFEHVLCVSAALRDELIARGPSIKQAQVVYNGIDLEAFAGQRKQSKVGGTCKQLKLLYAGQLVWHKGVHTAVEAMSRLYKEGRIERLSLTLLGSGHPDYESHLRTMVERADLEPFVHFHTRIPREEMPAFLQGFNVLIFPSIYEEPLARIVQEAMAAGLVVIGTTTGGTKEILREGQNGLTFRAEDSGDLARQIKRLLDNSSLRPRLAETGRRDVVAHFGIERMVDEVETYIENVMAEAAG